MSEEPLAKGQGRYKVPAEHLNITEFVIRILRDCGQRGEPARAIELGAYVASFVKILADELSERSANEWKREPTGEGEHSDRSLAHRLSAYTPTVGWNDRIDERMRELGKGPSKGKGKGKQVPKPCPPKFGDMVRMLAEDKRMRNYSGDSSDERITIKKGRIGQVTATFDNVVAEERERELLAVHWARGESSLHDNEELEAVVPR